MPAYFIAQISVHDQELYQNYLAGFMPIFERYGGRLLVTSAKTPEIIEGDWPSSKLVVMEFPDLENAKAWLHDPDYKALAQHRYRSAETNLILVEGAG